MASPSSDIGLRWDVREKPYPNGQDGDSLKGSIACHLILDRANLIDDVFAFCNLRLRFSSVGFRVDRSKGYPCVMVDTIDGVNHSCENNWPSLQDSLVADRPVPS